jgi:glycogen debranching enzyme
MEGGHGLGLYYHDCRYLNGYELRLGGEKPNVLVSTAEQGYEAVFQLSNHDIRMDDGRLIHKENIGIKWTRVVNYAGLSLYDTILFQNFTTENIKFPISLTFSAAFEDVFAVRGMLPERFGRLLQQPAWEDESLQWVYAGADGVYRGLTISFPSKPEITDGTAAHFHIELQPREIKHFVLSIRISESNDLSQAKPKDLPTPSIEEIGKTVANMQHSRNEWRESSTGVHTDSLVLNRTLERSLSDVRLLRSAVAGKHFFAAGVPWFVTLFGRDSLITSLQTLMYDPEITKETLRVLAHYQGRKVNNWTEEQPGRILHELRVGEMALSGEIPYTPYYGTIDATPLFLVLLAGYASWTGDLSLFDELRENVELAFTWIAEYGDSDGDGYVEYKSSSEHGLINQGWKDSGNAIVNADCNIATPPIALVEVQGYVYMAKMLMTELFRRTGDGDTADRLEKEAKDLYTRFNRDFWLEDKSIYAMALQNGGKPAAVASSNPGHALWAGIADPDKARRTMERLLGEDMFSGWGVRTLSNKEMAYNPASYHLGSVWPHDNAIIAAGLRRYGFDDAAHRVSTSIIEAAMHFKHFRMPELFTGFTSRDFQVPVKYPVACHPQAWGAGAIPFLIETMLGVKPEAFEHRLRIVRPRLPDYVDRMTLEGLRVGSARVSLQFERSEQGVSARAESIEGDLDVIVEL